MDMQLETMFGENMINMAFYIAVLVTFNIYYVDGAGNLLSENWKFHFPGGSTMGLFLAVALPLEKSHSTYLAYNFEANYILPNEQVQYEYPPLIVRKGKMFERRFVYDAIESKMKMYGFSGKNCLLRTICEASEETLQLNGVMGDILHVIFTPSTSKDNITDDYELAEVKGRQRNCDAYNKNCTISILSLISWIGEAL